MYFIIFAILFYLIFILVGHKMYTKIKKIILTNKKCNCGKVDENSINYLWTKDYYKSK